MRKANRVLAILVLLSLLLPALPVGAMRPLPSPLPPSPALQGRGGGSPPQAGGGWGEVHAATRGNPWINLLDGVPVPTTYAGAAGRTPAITTTAHFAAELDRANPAGAIQQDAYPGDMIVALFTWSRVSSPTLPQGFIMTATYPAQVDYVGNLTWGPHVDSCEHLPATRTISCTGRFPALSPPQWQETYAYFQVNVTCRVYDTSVPAEPPFYGQVRYSDGALREDTVLLPVGSLFYLESSTPALLPGYAALLYTAPEEGVPDCCTTCELDTYVVANGDTANPLQLDDSGPMWGCKYPDFIANDCHHSLWFTPTENVPYTLELYLVTRDKPFGDARLVDTLALPSRPSPKLAVLTDLRELFQEFEETAAGSARGDSNGNCIRDYYEAVVRLRQYANDHDGVVLDVRQNAYTFNYDYYDAMWDRESMGKDIDALIARLPRSLEHIALVGDDAVIPFRRVRVLDWTAVETVYARTEIGKGRYTGNNPTLLDSIHCPGARGCWMSDIPYGTFAAGISTTNPRLDVGLGRIFRDRPLELVRLIEALEQPLNLVRGQSRVFVLNAKDEEDGVAFHEVAKDTLVPPVRSAYGKRVIIDTHPFRVPDDYAAGAYWMTGQLRLDPRIGRSLMAWVSWDLHCKVKGQSDLLTLCGHGTHWRNQDGNLGSLNAAILSNQQGAAIPCPVAPSTFSLLVAAGCHNGLNIARRDGDNWEDMISRRVLELEAALLAVTSYDTGWSYWGNYDYFHDHMRRRFLEAVLSGRHATLGAALRAAHNAYNSTTFFWKKNNDTKVLYTVVLYGLPTQPIQRAAEGTTVLTVQPAAALPQAAVQSITRTVVISHVEVVTDTLGRVAFVLPHNGRPDGPDFGPILPVIHHRYPLPAGTINVGVTLAASVTHPFGRPVEMTPLIPFDKGLGPLTGTFTMTQPYPERVLEYVVYTDVGGLVLDVVLVPLQYDSLSGQVTLYDRLDYQVVYSAPLTLTVAAITVNNGLPVSVDQPTLPVTVTVNAAAPFSGLFYWEIHDAAGTMLSSDYGALTLGSGTWAVSFLTNTAGWDPGPKQVLVAFSTAETGTVVAAGQRVFTALGRSLEMNLDRPAYGPADATATVAAHVRSESGAPVPGLAEELALKLDGADLSLPWTAGAAYTATLDLTGILTGQHFLSVTLSGNRVAESSFLVDHDPPSSTLSSPAEAKVAPFAVTISGVDDLSGIATYHVQYSIGADGPWVDWLTRTAGYDYSHQGLDDLSPTFGPTQPVFLEPDTLYCFRVRAMDQVGNLEAEHPTADTCTRYTERWDLYLPLAFKAWPPPCADGLEPVGHVGGPLYGLAVQGPYAYAAEGAALAVLDVSDPANPWRVGYVQLPYQSNDVAVAGDYAYVTTNAASGLRVISVADKANPVEVGAYEMYGYSLGVALWGDHLYVIQAAPGSRSLVVFSLADPAQPTFVGGASVSLYAWNLHAVGDHVYVAGGPDGLQVFDVSDPANPTQVGAYAATGANGVYVADGYAYVAADAAGLQVLAVADPANPTPVGSYPAAGAYDVVVAASDPPGHTYAYLADQEGLLILSVDNPANPTRIGSTGAAGAISVVRVAAGGLPGHTYAYAVGGVPLQGGRLYVLAVSDPAQPAVAGIRWAFTDMEGIDAAAGLAGVSDRDLGLGVVSLADPRAPTLVGVYDAPGLAVDVHLVDDAAAGHPYAYLVDNVMTPPFQVDGYVRVISLADPANPVQVGFYQTSGWLESVYVQGDYAYALRYDSLRVLSVADKAHPVEVGALAGLQSPQQVDVRGDTLYLAGGSAGLVVVSVADPHNPVQVSQYNTVGTAWGVHVVGDIAYVAANFGLELVDVSNPLAPVGRAYLATPGQAQAVRVAGDYAYVAAGVAGLRLVCVADPDHPTEVDFYDVGGATDVYAAAGYSYIADRSSGLIVLRLVPRAPLCAP